MVDMADSDIERLRTALEEARDHEYTALRNNERYRAEIVDLKQQLTHLQGELSLTQFQLRKLREIMIQNGLKPPTQFIYMNPHSEDGS
jgi:predicted nuclease with TOPRIM domain